MFHKKAKIDRIRTNSRNKSQGRLSFNFSKATAWLFDNFYMRIGIFDPYLDDTGGGEKYMLSLAQCLSHENRVEVFWDKKEDFEKAGERFSLDLSRVSVASNIFSPKTSLVNRLISSAKYDAIIFLSDGSLPFVLSKQLFLHIQQPLKLQLNWKNRIKLLKVKKIFFNSHFTQSFFKQLEGKSMVLYPPVYINFPEARKENTILHVGRFRPKESLDDFKKQTVMIDVFKQLVDNGLEGWKFVLAVGLHERDREAFSLLSKKAGGYPIEFLINLDSKRLWDVYSKAKIYWHASGFGEDLKKHPEYAEHFGISTVEAMGAGAVPVVINAGGQKEIVEHKKNGFLWSSLEELKEQTLWLIQDKKLLEGMSKEAKKRAEFFSGDRFCSEIRELIL